MKQNLKINRTIEDKVEANPPKSRKKKKEKKFRKHRLVQVQQLKMEVPKRKNTEKKGRKFFLKEFQEIQEKFKKISRD